MKIILDCDPGHDDAIALLLALASPEVELLGVTTVHGNQTLEKTTINALKLLEFVDRTDIPVAAGAPVPFSREPFIAEYVHGKSGMDGPTLPEPKTKPVARARGRLHRRDPAGLGRARHHRPDRAADEHRPLPRNAPGRCAEGRPDRADGRRVRRGERHAGGRVQHLGRPGGRGARLPERAGRDDDRPRRLAPGDLRPRAAPRRSKPPGAWARWSRSCSSSTGVSTSSPTAGTARRSTMRSRWRTPSSPGSSRRSSVGVRVDCGEELGRGRTNCDLRGRVGWEPNAHVGVGIDADAFISLLVERISSLG